MEIYLIRHTTPAVAHGTCYGQSDIDVTESFAAEAKAIRTHLPATIAQVYASPLQRCSKLAAHLFPHLSITYADALKEIHCGEWELLKWNDIAPSLIQPWMDDFVNYCMPGGENYVQLYQRVTTFFNNLPHHASPIALVTHGGVLRSILAAITSTPLQDSFNAFSIYYGAVIHLSKEVNTPFNYRILHNPQPHRKEAHQPTNSTSGSQ